MSDPANPTALAERVLSGAEYDFSRLPASTWTASHSFGGGMRMYIARSSDLPDAALDAILGWRLGQYLLTGFFDPDVIEASGVTQEDRSAVHPQDVHALVLDRCGALCAYITVKQPEGHEGWFWGDRNRPLFPCEEVHGRQWQDYTPGADSIDLGHCWEVARFVSDQRRRGDPEVLRATIELALRMVRMGEHPDWSPHVQLLVGDLDPEVALRNARFFFIPIATFPEHRVELEKGHPLAPRYREHPTSPFATWSRDVDYPTWVRWSDIALALAQPDESALLRMLALREFVNLKESTLKRPQLGAVNSGYPRQAILSPSSAEAGSILWERARNGRLPGWSAEMLGPGETLSLDDVVWSVDGFARAVIALDHGEEHLAALGPEVAHVPLDSSPMKPSRLEAVTQIRVLRTDHAEFESFWRERQKAFATSTEALYGLNLEVLG